MTKKALILLLTAIGGAVVIGTTATVVTVIVVNNNKEKIIVEKPTEDKTSFVYDGTEKIYKIEESDLYTVTGNKQTNAGTYTVTVKLKDEEHVWSDKSSEDITFSFTIDKASVLVPTVDTSLYEFDYDGTAKGYTIATSDKYTITGNSNIVPGDYTAVVALNDKNNYKWSNGNSNDLSYDYTIKGIELTNENLVVTGIENQTYTGSELTLNLSATTGNTALILNKDYTITYQKNINAGTAKIIITGIGLYRGTVEKTFTILGKAITSSMLEDINNKEYTGNPITPVKLTDGNKVLVLGTDYEVSYQNNTNPGNATFTVTGKGNYSGSFDGSFVINKAQSTVGEISVPTNLIYNAQAQPLLTEAPTYSGGTLKYSVDDGNTWTETIPTGTDAGQYTVKYKVFGDEFHENSLARDYIVNIGKATPTFDTLPTIKNSLVYDEDNQELVVAGSITSEVDVLYSLDENNWSSSIPTKKNAGTYPIYYKVTSNTSNYDNIESTKLGDAVIAKADVGAYSHPTAITGIVYDGSEYELIQGGYSSDGSLYYKVNDGDYSLDIPKATAVGTYTIKYYVQGDENHNDSPEGTIIVTISEVEPTSLDTCTLEAIPTQTYTGSAIEPVVVVRNDNNELLTEGTDYTVAYSSNINAGTANVTITGINGYKDTIQGTFTINSKNINDVELETISNQTYNGSEITPVKLTDGNKVLVVNTDYTVDYEDNTDAGTATFTITGHGNYTGTIEGSFTIVAKEIDSDMLQEITNPTYTGSAFDLVIMNDGNKALIKDTDYTVTYDDNVNAGTVEFTITGIGNYDGSINGIFTILAKEIEQSMVQDIADQIYTGDAIEPTVVIKYGELTLTLNTDYTISYTNNTDVGTATISITGNGNYSGSTSKTFKIVSTQVEIGMVQAIPTQTYTGSELTPIVLKDGTYTLIEGTDYNITYSDNVDAGTASYTVTGIGNYGGEFNSTFTINPKSIENTELETITAKTYTGSEITPIKLTDGNKVLVLNTDYTVDYSSNINAGTASYEITGTGNYTGTINGTFTISPKSLDSEMVENIEGIVYNGQPKTPVKLTDGNKVLVLDTDYTVDYEDNTDAGTASYKITGTGNYTGTIEGSFTIGKATISVAHYPSAIENLRDDGFEHALIDAGETDLNIGYFEYKLDDGGWGTSIPKAIATGTYKVYYRIISDNNNYDNRDFTDPITVTIGETSAITITEDMLNSYTTSFTYDGQEHRPNITLTNNAYDLVLGTDYELSFSGETQKDAGTYTITITGKGQYYTGSFTKQYTINQANIEISLLDQTIDYNPDGEYSINQTEYDITSGQVFGTDDLDISIVPTTTIVNAGSYTLTASITNSNYNATIINATLNIQKIAPNFVNVPSAITGLIYSGQAQTLITEEEVIGGTAEYSLDNGATWSTQLPKGTDAGTYTVKYRIKGDDNHFDQTIDTVTEITIDKKDLAGANITLTPTSYTYDGTAKEPSTTVKFGTTTVASDNYTVTYENNTNAGSASVIVTAKDNSTNYTGSGTVNFTISPKSINNVNITFENANPEYTGSEIELVITSIKDGETDITDILDGHYEATYANNVHAGTATITITITDDINYAGSRSVNFTIKKAIPVVNITLAPETTYDGNPYTLVLSGSSTFGNVEYSLTNQEDDFSQVFPRATNAGTYYVYYRVQGNDDYISIGIRAVDGNVVIKPKAPEVIAPTAKSGLVYNGSAQVLVNAGSSEQGHWEYKIGNTLYSEDLPEATNAGDYTVYYRFVGNGNYSDIPEASFEINIAKADPTYTAPTAKPGLVYNGSGQDLINPGTTNGGTLQYYLTSWSTSIPQATNAAESLTVKYRIVGDSNFNGVDEQQLTVSIAKKVVEKPTEDSRVFTYNKQEQTYEIAESTEYNISGNLTQTSAGDYLVGIALASTQNTMWDDGTTQPLQYHFIINKKDISITLDDQEADWDGKEPTAAQDAYQAEGLISGDILGITITKASGTDADDYTLTATITNGNYNATITPATFTIKKVLPPFTAPTATNHSYDGNTHNLVAGGSTSYGTLYYKLDDGAWGTSIPTAKEAGSYVVKYYVEGDGNHLDTEVFTINASIAKATPQYTPAQPKSLTYTGEAQELITVSSTSCGTFKYSFVEDGEYTETIPTETNAGTYTIYYKLYGNSNYNDSDLLTVTVTIKKAQVATPTAATSSYTYSGTEITHALTTSDYYTITNNIETNVGNYTATVTLNDTNNYCWQESSYNPDNISAKDYEFSITPKALTQSMVTLSSASDVYNGELQKPTVTVADSGYITASDYTITNDGGTYVGNYTVRVEGQGNYTGTIEKTYSITARPITITLANQSSPYLTSGAYPVSQTAYTTGNGQLITGDDLGITITKADGTNVGTYQITATITNSNYNPTYVNGTYTINNQGIDIASATILLDGETTAPEYTYNGQIQKPTIVITSDTDDVNDYELVLGQDYTVSINGNQTRAANYTITITAKGNYFTGSTSRTYTIANKELVEGHYTLTFDPIIYTGSPIGPTTSTFTLIDNDLDSSVSNVTSQFTLTSTKQTAAGTGASYSVTVKPKVQASQTNYTNSVINTTYTITPRDVNTCTFSEVFDVPLTSNVATNGYFPEPTIMYNSYELIKDTDYTLSYGANNALGKGSVTITGIGNFELSKTIDFNIVNTQVILSFDPNGGTLNDSTSTQNVTFEYPYDTQLPTPTKAHYDFIGWSPVGDSSIKFNVDDTLDKLVGFTEFEAQWKLHNYTIIYGNVSEEETYGNPTTYTYETPTITLIDSTDPTFMGWYTDQECTEGNEIYEIPYHSSGDKAVYAKWNIDVYNITYNSNGGSEITEHLTYTQSTSTFELPQPTMDYYNFSGWYDNSNLTGTPVTKITQGESGDREFWAKWTPTTYYLTYKNTGDNVHNNPETYTVETQTFPLNPETKAGNIFVGWFDAASGGNQITEIALGSHTSMNIYARFIPIPTTFEIEITHDLSGSTTEEAGTISGEDIGTKYVGNSITKTFTVNDTYTFLGWYNGDTLETTDPELTVTLTGDTTTYTAKVARYKLVLNKNSDGGLIDPSESQYLRTGEQITLTATTNLGGYVFCGWYRGAETTPVTTEYTLNVTMASDDVRYTAKWSHVILELQNSDGSSNNSVTLLTGKNYVAGQTINLTATPSSGYAFRGWYSGDNKLSGDLTYEYTFKTENETLYAKFVKNNINVTQGKLETNFTDGDTPEPFFIMSTGGNYGTCSTNNIMDEDELVTYTATNNSNLMFAGWYEIGSGDSEIVVGNPNSTQTTYSLISRNSSIKLAPGTIKTIYPIFISKLDANSIPGTLKPTATGGNYSGDPLVITPQESDAYEFTKYTIGGVDVESTDSRLDGNVLSYTEDLDTTLENANNFYNRIRIVAVYTRTSALIKTGKLINDGDTFLETSAVGSVTKNGDVYTATPATGYEFVKWQWQMADGSTNRADLTDERVSGNILTLNSEDHEDYFAIFAPLTNIQYTVNYYLQNTDNDNYTLDHSTTGNNGTTDKQLTVTPGTITGATIITTDLTKTIAGDGSTVFDLYFDRDLVTVNYQYNNGTSTDLMPVSVRYGSLPKANTKAGWTKAVAGWYTDCDFTNEFTGTITSTKDLYARWQGDIILNSTIDSIVPSGNYVTVKLDDDTASDAINNNLSIPSYYNGKAVEYLDINNLIVNEKIYSYDAIPNTVRTIIYGEYKSNKLEWIVLDTNNCLKILCSTGLDSVTKANVQTTIETINSSLGFEIDLLSIANIEKYNDIIENYTLSEKWWLKDTDGNNRYRVNENSTEYTLATRLTGAIRPYIEL